MTIWRPGMRCVCIGEFDWLDDLDGCVPKKGVVYTVEAVEWCDVTCLTALDLVEIDMSRLVGRVVSFQGRQYILGARLGWDSTMFRPLSERRLDQFRAHLAPTPQVTAGSEVA